MVSANGAVQAQVRHRLRGDQAQESVARALGLSSRSLQRRRAEVGTSFRAVAEGVRREEAERLLAQPERSIAEVAELVGFTDQAAFTRAFTRWLGTSPQRWRRER